MSQLEAAYNRVLRHRPEINELVCLVGLGNMPFRVRSIHGQEVLLESLRSEKYVAAAFSSLRLFYGRQK